MPDFCRPARGTRARLDSAVASLLHLGVGPERIVAESAGPGWPAGVVVRQDPAPGAPLTPRTRVVLSVGGTGALDTLPFPLRDTGEGFGVGTLLGLADNPILKLGLFVRRAGGFVAPSGGDPVAALRWIELFGLSSAPWPRELWPAVARLLPSLHRVAGRAEAIPLALGIVFGLPVAGVRIVDAAVELAASTRLGGSHTRLGVDTTLAGGAVVGSALEILVGPVSLDGYLDHANRRAQRDALYRLVLPAHIARVEERWTVGNAGVGSRLEDVAESPVLGINARLGEAV